ncbi:hypothetical protein [Clostridium tertium]|uniref:hypothetical protein n=1 Tax=Clostridium tertium TaxID=1559 RepID=UPI0023B207DE|nr:hypothetical protein [Clostridium tertium]
MRSVAINGSKNEGLLLPVKWMLKFLEKKGINVFAYKMGSRGECYRLSKEKIESNYNDYHVIYVKKDMGRMISADQDIEDNILLNIDDLLKNREDRELVDTICEMNNSQIAKIVLIPDNLNYVIYAPEVGDKELIVVSESL